MKFCLLVVLYNPTQQDLERLDKYAQSKFFTHITVWDNSNGSHQSQIPSRMEYVFKGKNEGLSIPYNYMINWCFANRYDYLCLMDQDSNYPLGEMKKLIDFINEHPQSLNNTAIIAPRVYTRHFKALPRKKELTVVKSILNSGCFLNIFLLANKLLRYDENIFLYYVDIDFCMKIYESNCLVQVYEDSVFVQNVGNELKKTKKYYGYHEPYRYYLIAHNQRYCLCKHWGCIKGGVWAFIKNTNLLRKIIFYEDNRRDKIKACLRGMFK